MANSDIHYIEYLQMIEKTDTLFRDYALLKLYTIERATKMNQMMKINKSLIFFIINLCFFSLLFP